jgi:hypothetical protein
VENRLKLIGWIKNLTVQVIDDPWDPNPCHEKDEKRS